MMRRFGGVRPVKPGSTRPVGGKELSPNSRQHRQLVEDDVGPTYIRAMPPQLKLKQRARFGQVMWCAFPEDAPLPQFRGEHPVVVVQSAKDLRDTCVVVPMTTAAHNPSPTVYKLKRGYNPAAKAV